jgi:hypothetical protein
MSWAMEPAVFALAVSLGLHALARCKRKNRTPAVYLHDFFCQSAATISHQLVAYSSCIAAWVLLFVLQQLHW